MSLTELKKCTFSLLKCFLVVILIFKLKLSFIFKLNQLKLIIIRENIYSCMRTFAINV